MGIPPKPDPIVCPACGESWNFVLEDGEWELDAEWWHDPALAEPKLGFTCSRRCYLKRKNEKEGR